MNAIIPYLSQQFGKQAEAISSIVNFSLKILVSISVPISFALVILASKFIDLFYGQRYQASVIVLQSFIYPSGISMYIFLFPETSIAS